VAAHAVGLHPGKPVVRFAVGPTVGDAVGAAEDAKLGAALGVAVSAADGAELGTCEYMRHRTVEN
jgi:hypothetical protein